MPVIPTYERQRTIPSTTGQPAPSIEGAGIIGQQVAQIGDAVSNKLFDVQDRLNKVERTTALNRGLVDYTEKLHDLRFSYENDTRDPSVVSKDYDDKAKALRDQLLGGFTDTTLRGTFFNEAEKLRLSQGVDVRTAARRRWVDKIEGDATDGLDTIRRQVALPETQANPLTMKSLNDTAERLIGQMALVSPEKAAKLRIKFMEGVAGDQLQGWINGHADPLDAWQKLRTGDLPPQLSEALKILPPDTQAKMRKDALSQAADLFRIGERDRAEAERAERGELQGAVKSYFDAKKAGDLKGMDTALNTMRGVTRVPGAGELYGKLLEQRYEVGDGGANNLELVGRFEQGIARGTLTLNDVAKARGNGLDFKTADKFTERLIARNNQRFSDALEYAKRAVAYPTQSLINPSAADRAAMRLYNKIELDLMDARDAAARSGKDLDPLDFVRTRIEPIRAAEQAEELKQIERNFARLPKDLNTREKIAAEKVKALAGRSPYSVQNLDNKLDVIERYEDLKGKQ